MENKKSYYAIIPANVRYDNDLTPNAKLLYGEITALCNEKGYCWANNEYFASLYGVSKQSISSWISQLSSKKYISTSLEYKDGTMEILNRYIKLFEYPIQEILNTPIQKNLKDNNTSFNNTSNTIVRKTDNDCLFDKFWTKYPKKVAKPSAQKAFKRIKVTDSILADMLTAIDTMKTTTKQEFIPYPATWLNQKRWEDETEEPQNGAKLIQTGDNSFKLE